MADWHKRYSRDALNGMRALTLEESGFYSKTLDLIYEEEGPVTEASIRVETGVRDKRTFSRILGSLIAKGKLFHTADGRVMDERAMFELTMMKTDSAERKAAGSKGGRKSALKAWRSQPGQSEMFGDLSRTPSRKPNENKGGDEAGLAHAHTRTREATAPIGEKLDTSRGEVGELVPDCSGNSDGNANVFNGRWEAPLEHIDSDIEEESPPLVPPHSEKPRLKSRRAQPLPPDWQPPDPTDRQSEIVSAWPKGAYEREIEKFTNNAIEKGRTALDWDAAFRNWIINADEFRQRNTGGGRHERASGWRF